MGKTYVMGTFNVRSITSQLWTYHLPLKEDGSIDFQSEAWPDTLERPTGINGFTEEYFLTVITDTGERWLARDKNRNDMEYLGRNGSTGY